MRGSMTILALLFATSLIHAQEPAKPAPPPHAAISSVDTQAMRADLQRMRALVQQMQTNLAFVTNTQGPLKHQFELEIEMWQLEIAGMERRLGTSQEDGTKR